MKGELPIPYIVGIIIAVAVIAVIIYIFLTQTNIWQDVVIRKYCEAKAFEYCNKPEDARGDWPTDERCSTFPELGQCPTD